MSLELLNAHQTSNGIAVMFATDRGIERLEGSCDEITRLAAVMSQIAVLAPLSGDKCEWLEEVAVGDAIVKFGLNDGQGRVRILRP
jgi:hypothetical protein